MSLLARLVGLASKFVPVPEAGQLLLESGQHVRQVLEIGWPRQQCGDGKEEEKGRDNDDAGTAESSLENREGTHCWRL